MNKLKLKADITDLTVFLVAIAFRFFVFYKLVSWFLFPLTGEIPAAQLFGLYIIYVNFIKGKSNYRSKDYRWQTAISFLVLDAVALFIGHSLAS